MKNQNKNKFLIFYFTLILLLISSLSFSQKIVLHGNIFDQNGEPVKTAFIKKRGTNLATISNKRGEFNFSILNSDSVLVISKKGYYDKEVYLKGEKSIRIELIQIDNSFFKNEENTTLGGFGQWKDVNSSNSISHFLLEKYHHSDKSLLDILEIVPGLIVRNESGQPGANASVLSRGYESVISNQPLIIVDGVTINIGINMPNISPEISALSSINVKDVRRIEVLRDAASTSIFGSRGANGVIIIETHRGAKKTFEVKNHTQFGVNFPINGINMMEPLSYFDLINESLIAASSNPINFPENPSVKNWQKEILRTGIIANNTLVLQGGGNKSQFYLSGNINHTTGVLQKSNFNEGGVRLNYSTSIAKWLDFKFNTNYSEARQESPIHGENQIDSNPYIYAHSYPPISKEDVRNIPELSIPFGQLDPLELINQQETENRASFLLGGVGIKIKFSEHLSFHSKVSGDYSFYTKNALMLYPRDNKWTETNELNSKQQTSLYNWEFNNYLKYQQIHNKSNWLFLLGSNEIYLNTNNVINYGFIENLSQTETLLLDIEGRNSRRISAFYTKLHYAYNERFDLSAGFRREKILNQEGVDQFGIFPSFATGIWLKKPETNKDVIFSGMKLFLGWGVPGANRFYPINYFKINLDEQYLTGTTLINKPKYDPNARWETTEEWNIGFQTAWINTDLNFKITYFDRMRNNVAYLTYENTDNEISTQWNYTGRIYNSGYELELDYKKSFEKFGVFGGFNMQINSSKVLSLGESNSGKIGHYPQYVNTGIPLTVFKEGNTPGAFWGYINEGVIPGDIIVAGEENVKPLLYENGNPVPGDYKFKDLDNNGIINENDMAVIGNPTPDITYLINGGVVLNNFDLTFVLDGATGGDILNVTKAIYESTGGYNNRSVTMKERWSESNPSGELARVHINDPNNNNRIHSGMIENGSFFRFNKIELGYDFSFKNGNKNRVYISAHDFITVSTYSNGVPIFSGIDNCRGADFGIHPFSSTLLIGLQLGI